MSMIRKNQLRERFNAIQTAILAEAKSLEKAKVKQVRTVADIDFDIMLTRCV